MQLYLKGKVASKVLTCGGGSSRGDIRHVSGGVQLPAGPQLSRTEDASPVMPLPCPPRPGDPPLSTVEPSHLGAAHSGVARVALVFRKCTFVSAIRTLPLIMFDLAYNSAYKIVKIDIFEWAKQLLHMQYIDILDIAVGGS